MRGTEAVARVAAALDPSNGEARDWLERELEGAAYREHNDPIARAIAAIERFIDGLLSADPSASGALPAGIAGLVTAAVVALLLAAIGIYGVIAFVVGLSKKEIAIRLALGADGGKVLRVVMTNGMVLVLSGVAVGLIGARLGGKLLETQLYGVRASDPATLAAVSGAVVLVALLATWIPARRAAAVEPQTVLKGE